MPLFMERRFSIIITLFVFITLIYGAEAIAISGQNSLDRPQHEFSEEELQEFQEVADVLGVDPPQDIRGNNNDIFAVFSDMASFLTFAPLNLPDWAFWVISLMISVVAITLIVLVGSIIYDIVKAFPLT